MRYLGIDYGAKQTGLAVCDDRYPVVCPLDCLPTGKDLIRRIADIASARQIEAVVVGLPLNMDDTDGPQAKRVRLFADELKKYLSVPVYLHDERLSSFEAEQKLAGVEMTRKTKRKRVNALAAAAILQSFLDSQSKQ